MIDIESYLQHPDSVNRYIGRALELFPGQVDFHLSKGHTLNYSKQYPQAIKAYKQSLGYARTDSLRSVIWGFIGDTWHQKATAGEQDIDDNFARAVRKGSFRADMKQCYKAYDHSLRYDPDNAMVLNNYAYFLSLEGRELEKALTMSSRAIALTDNNPTYLDTHAWVLFKLGRTAEAKKVMQQAIALDGAAGSLRGYPACHGRTVHGRNILAQGTRKGLRRRPDHPPHGTGQSRKRVTVMKPARILTLLFLFAAFTAAAQGGRDAIEEQKRVIAALEKRIADEERAISKIQEGRAATEERVRRLARQLDSRNQLLEETEKQVRLLRKEISRTDSVAGDLSSALERNRTQYAEMVREAYRNYKHNNYLTYIFSSRDFADVAKKITNLREVASMRERKLHDIAALSEQVAREKELLDRRKRSLDSVTQNLTAQKQKLQRDSRNARANIRQMSQKEKQALQRKLSQEQQLDVAISELRKLTKGNTEGASFSTKTTGLRLPVTAGSVKRYKENMAEIAGPKGAHVISIYDGKVVEIKRNRITNKYDVFVAHGEYITSYANMGSICVEKGQKVARNEQLGTIGSSVNIMTMETEYKLVFGIYPPNPGEKLRAENCFKR